MQSSKILSKLLSTCCLIVLGLAACKPQNTSNLQAANSVSGQPLPPAAQALWDTHVKISQSKGVLQENCHPIQLQPDPGKTVKGLVVLYHGFTGCPIQFISAAKTLREQGYHVLLPLLPGEGRKPLKVDPVKRVIEDDLSAMPTTPEPYLALSKLMNDIARNVPGFRFVGGLSGGGAQAIGSLIEGAQTQDGSNVWNRSLLFVPLIKLPGIQGNASDLINIFKPDLNVGFGQSCDNDFLDKNPPRNGQCDFTVRQVQALETFGRDVAAKAAMIKIPLQVVGVEKDGATDNTEIMKFFDRVGSQDKKLCFYPEGVNHAILFESDDKLRDTRPWAPEVEAKLIRYINEGKNYEVNGVSAAEKNRDKCELAAPLPKKK